MVAGLHASPRSAIVQARHRTGTSGGGGGLCGGGSSGGGGDGGGNVHSRFVHTG